LEEEEVGGGVREPSTAEAAKPPKGRRRPPEYRRARGLSPKHHMAIELKVEGLSNREIADRLGLHRVTITNWMNHDHKFRAELNRRAAEVLDEERDLARATRRKALQRISQAVDEGDVKTAFRFYQLTEKNAALFETGQSQESRLEQEAAVKAFTEKLNLPIFEDDKVGPILREYSAEIAAEMNRWEFLVTKLKVEFAEEVEVPEAPEDIVDLGYEVDRGLRFILEALWLSEGEGLRALDPNPAASQDAFLLEAKARHKALIAIELEADAASDSEEDEDAWPGNEAMAARVLGLAEMLSLLAKSVSGARDFGPRGRDDAWFSIDAAVAASNELVETVTMSIKTEGEKAKEVGVIAAEFAMLRNAIRWFLRAFELSMRDQPEES
jgi:DNA-binding CsgD family transcriptional regulator